MTRNHLSRREMLKATAAAVALPALVPGSVLGLDGAAAPSETVHVGVIGCGGRSRLISEAADVKPFKVVACADVEIAKAEGYAKELSAGAKWGVYQDFRKMLQNEKLDGVMVETTTHARSWIVIQAMQAGLDTYIEKPMCLTISEGRTMVKAARKYNRVTQVGTQQRSMPINNWASDLVKNGALARSSPSTPRTSSGPTAGPRPRRRTSRVRSSRGGTCGPTRPSFAPTIPRSTAAGPAGGTMTAEACASA